MISKDRALSMSRWRRIFWPIQGDEVKKFLPMALMMFLILFNYTILRNTKDSLVIAASGAEIIPFLKGLIVLPFSIVFVTVYAKLSNILTREKLFYTNISLFLLVFLLFSLYIYPNRHFLHASPETLTHLATTYPKIQHVIPLIGNWGSTLFYLFAELWATVILSLLFWQFANEITRIHEARRFYAMFGLIGHFALIAAGQVGIEMCDAQTRTNGSYENYILHVAFLLTAVGILIMAIYRWISIKVLTDPKYYDHAKEVKDHTEKTLKLSLMESLRHIASSRYLGYIALMLIGYGLCMNVTGILWKKQVVTIYPDGIGYARFMGEFYRWVGVITILLIFFFKGVVERFGWLKGALFTPLVLLATSIPFFAFMLFQEPLTPYVAWMGVTPVMAAVLIGSAQQIFSKSAKFSMFDPTKEMAYIPLDPEMKTKGKAAIDVTGYSFSKALGGYLTALLLAIFEVSDMMMIAPYLAIITLAMIAVWFFAIKELSILYYRLVNRQKLDPYHKN
jgi:AAA family ATP:ADP antiporter